MTIVTLISYLLLTGVCVFCAISLHQRGEFENSKSAFIAYVGFSVLFFGIWFFSIAAPSYLLIFCMIAVLLTSFGGNYLNLYLRSQTFDRYLHAWGSFCFSLLFYIVITHFIFLTDSPLARSIFIFLLGNTIGVIFELLEAKADRKKAKEKKEAIKNQKGLIDTDTDMLFNLIGSAVAGLFSYFWL